MKNLFIALVLAVFLATGCAGLSQLYPTVPVEQQACTLNPGMVLCKVSISSGLTLEQWRDILADAILVPVAMNEVDGHQVYEILNSVVMRLEGGTPMTSNELISYLVEKYELNPAAVMLLKRRLDRLVVIGAGDMVFDQASKNFLIEFFKSQRDEFGAFFPMSVNER